MTKTKESIEYQLIWKCINNVADSDEVNEFEVWVKSDVRHQQLVDHLKLNKDDAQISEQNINFQWKRLNRNIGKRKIKLKNNWLQYAAAILILTIIGASVFKLIEQRKSHIVAEQIIQPGSSKAILTLDNGQLLVLNDSIPQKIRNTKGNIIAADTLSELCYTSQVRSEKIEYNTIEIPRGGEYKLVLADGSTVWLNSQTKLRFPITFQNNIREVYLEGEALFDVKSDSRKPFIVHTNNSSVKVYGTTFNIMCYSDENEEQTTLVEGSVALMYNNKEVFIKPGQQSKITKNSKEVILKEVDTTLYTDWYKGMFLFENMPLNEVARKISRWYDVQFFFSNEEIKTRKMSGGMKRDTDFDQFMKLIGQSVGADIKVNDKSVLITAKY